MARGRVYSEDEVTAALELLGMGLSALAVGRRLGCTGWRCSGGPRMLA
jgi:hypothetical protein